MNSRADFLRQADRKFTDFLRATVTGSAFFPLELQIGKSKRAATYEDRRRELLELRANALALGFQIEWAEVEDVRFGRHERPNRAFFADESAYLRALGKTSEVKNFRSDVLLIRQIIPQLEGWLSSAVRKILANHGRWPRLLATVSWFVENPQSGLYLRQLPILGVDTKFIEIHRALIEELLRFLRPDLSGDTFHERFGLKIEEPLLRLRFLDGPLREACNMPTYVAEIALPRSQAAMLPLHGVRVIIVENLRNFLALPPLFGTVALFGGGDALVHWRTATWLQSCECHYWGDIDLHGFAMLARLRKFLPTACSFLMNDLTLQNYADLAVPDTTTPPACDDLMLTPVEIRICDSLRKNRVRLEQERIPMQAVEAACSAVVAAFPIH